jgi:hypothetical protein
VTTASGTVVGYDPGGNGSHGFAEMRIVDGAVVSVVSRTLDTVESALTLLEAAPEPLALGVDTLTCWSTGPGGWRPADRWLRQKYKDVEKSVVTPNGLFGSMGLNGMALLIALRLKYPDLPVTETHPKVLHWHLFGQPYDFYARQREMNEHLGRLVGISIQSADDHQWDATLSAFAAYKGVTGRWSDDLHAQECETEERIIKPCGSTNYFWPE